MFIKQGKVIMSQNPLNGCSKAVLSLVHIYMCITNPGYQFSQEILPDLEKVGSKNGRKL